MKVIDQIIIDDSHRIIEINNDPLEINLKWIKIHLNSLTSIEEKKKKRNLFIAIKIYQKKISLKLMKYILKKKKKNLYPIDSRSYIYSYNIEKFVFLSWIYNKRQNICK